MAELKVGSRVRVVTFDIAGLTGSVYQGLRSPVGETGIVIEYMSNFPECPWKVALDTADVKLMPDMFLAEELEVLDEK